MLHVQFVMLLAPGIENEYTGHNVHVSSNISANSVEYLPATQRVHAADPLVSLKVPATQLAQAFPSGPV